MACLSRSLSALVCLALPAFAVSLSYSTYLGGAGIDNATAVAVDPSGYIYVAGWMESGGGGGVDAFVTKLTPDGTTILWSKTLSGNGQNYATGLAVDASGNVYVAGWTTSTDFPVQGAYQGGNAGGRDAFLTKLAGNGTIVFSTYFGGTGSDMANGIAVDSGGNIYLAGETTSSNLPVKNALQTAKRGGADAFVTKFTPSGDGLVFATYVGGSLDDRANAIAVDSNGNAYLTGDTFSSDFPTAGALQGISGGGQDAFVLKIGPQGGLVYSTYLGGSGGVTGLPESGQAIAVDAAGSAYVAGVTSSANFPTVNAAQPQPAGGITDGFVAKLNPAGTGLVYSTYLGGNSIDSCTGIAVDSGGVAWIVGYTASTDLLMKAPAQGANGGLYDAFVVQLAANGGSIMQSTYLGGSASDSGNAIALSGGETWVVGQTGSTNFPLKDPPQGGLAGGFDGFVARLSTPPNYQGVLDIAGCSGLAGWAWDASAPYTPIVVGLYADGNLLSSVWANLYRADLFTLEMGDGRHAFWSAIPLRLKDGLPHTIDVRLPNGSSVVRSPQVLNCSGPEGCDDAPNCTAAAGWAWDRSDPNATLSVDLFDGASLLATLQASLYRPDLAAAGIGNGYHAYRYPIPFALADGRPHTIVAAISDTSIWLANTGRTITCTGPEGVEDVAACSGTTGWAWNRAVPSSTVSVDIYDGSTPIATVPADLYRPDLQAAGIGDGRHAYFSPIPLALKDGGPHTIIAKVATTSIRLVNTGRTVTCTGPEGSDDAATCSLLAGWAWDRSDPTATVSVDIYDGAAYVVTAVADRYRPDLQAAGIGDGRHAYSLSVPAALNDGRPHSIYVKISQVNQNLWNTGRTITCTGP